MDPGGRRERIRSLLVGGVLGASAVLAAARRTRLRSRPGPAGLAAFEGAPCYRETLEREELGEDDFESGADASSPRSVADVAAPDRGDIAK